MDHSLALLIYFRPPDKYVFLFLNQNMFSFKHPKHMFKLMAKKMTTFLEDFLEKSL